MNKLSKIAKNINVKIIRVGADNMPQKSDQGIVGKYPCAQKRQHEVGPGIDFKKDNLSNGPEIQSKIKQKTGEYEWKHE